TLEKELLSQYRSNRLISGNLSIEGVKKRFENIKTLFNNNKYFKSIESNFILRFHYIGTYLDFANQCILHRVQEQIDYISHLPQTDNNYKVRLNLLDDLIAVFERQLFELRILV